VGQGEQYAFTGNYCPIVHNGTLSHYGAWRAANLMVVYEQRAAKGYLSPDLFKGEKTLDYDNDILQ